MNSKMIIGVMTTLLVGSTHGAALDAQEKAKISQYEFNRNFLVACRGGVLDIVKDRLAAGADLEFNKNGTGLGWASYYGCEKNVLFLLSKKADVNAPDDLGRTPLMHAIRENKREMWIEILKFKQDLNVADKYSCSALTYAIAGAATNTLAIQDLLADGVDISRPQKNGDDVYECLNRDHGYGVLSPAYQIALRELFDKHRSAVRSKQAQDIGRCVQVILGDITKTKAEWAPIIGQYACETILEKHPLPSITEEEAKREMATQVDAKQD